MAMTEEEICAAITAASKAANRQICMHMRRAGFTMERLVTSAMCEWRFSKDGRSAVSVVGWHNSRRYGGPMLLGEVLEPGDSRIKSVFAFTAPGAAEGDWSPGPTPAWPTPEWQMGFTQEYLIAYKEWLPQLLHFMQQNY